ncbi:hypothetical protein ACFRMQ_40035 [Kitasatospora sp. NPDC056783]|uniref:hypothetical protein n=1 Tax=Kitasatospora sp. NPDC056783 TaxID=3345943 RepID=UPI0036A42EA2
MASRSEPSPHETADGPVPSARGTGPGPGHAARNHEELLRDRRAALRQDPAAVGAAELSRHVLGWARSLDAGERVLREALRDAASPTVHPDGAGADVGTGTDAAALGRAAPLAAGDRGDQAESENDE